MKLMPGGGLRDKDSRQIQYGLQFNPLKENICKKLGSMFVEESGSRL